MSLSFVEACKNEKRKIAELLLTNKEADIHYTDEKGRTALHYVAYWGYLDLAEMLIKAGADMNYGDHQGETPLSLAVSQKQKQVAILLIDKGADTAV